MSDEAGHRIVNVSYALDQLECTCGAVMPARHGMAWAEHRRTAGLKVVTVGQSIGKRLRGRTVAPPTSEEAAQ